MEQLKSMKQCLLAQAQGQMGNLQQVDAKELGEVIDMIKDLEEALYYCTITKAMEESEKKGGASHHTNIYYSEPNYDWRGMMDVNSRRYTDGGRMYYYDDRMYMANGGGNSNGGQSSNSSSGSNGRSYYRDNNGNEGRDGRSSNGNERYYSDSSMYMRDPREGMSGEQRRMYMEAKQMHHGKAKQLQELEKYVKDLTQDMVEMVEDASPEERQYLSNRMSTLATKISKLEENGN